MRHEISYRVMSSEELLRLQRSARIGIKAWLDDFLFLPVLTVGGFFIPGVLIAVGAGWLSQQVGFPFPGIVVAGILLVSGVLGVAVGVSAARDLRRSRRLKMTDLTAGKVEILRVQGARVVEQEEYNDEGPLYYFGIGGGKILFLGGQWLYDCDVYRLDPDLATIESDDWAPFPTSSFSLHRLPSGGDVLRIELAGERLIPEAVLSRKAELPSCLADRFRKGLYGDSFVVDGDFAELLKAERSGSSQEFEKAGGSRPQAG